MPTLRAEEWDAPGERGGDAYADPLRALRRILVETATYDALFRDGVAELSPDLAILYLQGTDSVGHAFARFEPPVLPGVIAAGRGALGQRARSVYFRHVDALLGVYRQLAQASRRAAAAGLRSRLPLGQAIGPRSSPPPRYGTAAKWHREEGIWLLWGNGVQPAAGRAAACGRSAPRCSICSACRAASACRDRRSPRKGVSGRARNRAPVDYRRGFRPPPEVRRGSGEAGDTSPSPRCARWAIAARTVTQAGTRRRRSPGDPDRTRTAASFDNEGLILRAAQRPEEARRAFESALARSPHSASAEWNLSELLRDLPAERRRSDDLLLHAMADGLANGPGVLAGRALQRAREGITTRRCAWRARARPAPAPTPASGCSRGSSCCRGTSAPRRRRTSRAPPSSGPSAPTPMPPSPWRSSASATTRRRPRRCAAPWSSTPTSHGCASSCCNSAAAERDEPSGGAAAPL